MATFETTVFTCQRCGRGWLRYPGRVCPEAMWTVIVGGERTDGEDCFGRIIPVERKLPVDTPTEM